VCFNALLADVDLCRLCRDVYPEKLGWAEVQASTHTHTHTHTYIYIYIYNI